MHRGAFVLLLGAAATGSAHAACQSMTAEEFEGFVEDANSAIYDDDLVRHGAIFRSFQERLPCMDEQVPVDAWSRFLVGYGVVEFAMGREWEHALDVAIHIKPTVARDYGPIEVRNHVPTARLPDADQPLLPDDAEIYLDGVRIEHEPRDLGLLHIVQQYKNGVWNTRLLMNEPFPEDWRVQFPDEDLPAADDGSGLVASAYALGGLAAGGQLVTEGAPNGAIPDVSSAAALIGVGTHGSWLFERPLGLFWDVAVPVQLGEIFGVEAYAGPAVGLGELFQLHGGFGVSSVGATDSEGMHAFLFFQPHLAGTLLAPMGGTTAMELTAGGGAAPGAWHARGRAGLIGGDGLGWSGGLEFSGVSGLFEEPGSNRRVSASVWRVGLRGGLSFR